LRYGAAVARCWLLRGISTFGVFLALSGELHAEERARLVYVREAGAEQCPGEVDLRLRVVARLGYDPFSPQASRVVLARISAGERELRGSVELVDERGISSGKRTLGSHPESCDELARGMALSISLAIDPELERTPQPATAAHADTPRSDSTPRPKPSAPATDTDVALPASATSTRARRFYAGVALSGPAARCRRPRWVPSASWGFEVRLGAGVGSSRASVLRAALKPRGNLHGSLIGPGASGCGLLNDFALCLVTVVAVQRLVSSEVSDPRASSGLFAGVGLA